MARAGDAGARQLLAAHLGGGFNPPEPTNHGGPDYGRFVDAVRAGATLPADNLVESAARGRESRPAQG